MIISTKRGTPAAELDKIIREFEAKGLSVTMIRGTDYNVFGLVGDTTVIDEKQVPGEPVCGKRAACVRALQKGEPPVSRGGQHHRRGRYQGGRQRKDRRHRRGRAASRARSRPCALPAK